MPIAWPFLDRYLDKLPIFAAEADVNQVRPQELIDIMGMGSNVMLTR
jgi:hypothetical protein